MPEEFEENTPTNTWRGNVQEEWCDYNGHLNLSSYVVIFDLATDAYYDALGLGKAYKNITNHSWFTAESHVCYVSEVFAGTEIYCTTQLIGFDKKRMHYFHRMYRVTGRILVATNELLALHVDLKERRVTEAATAALAPLERMLVSDQALPRPKQLGSKISIAPKI